MPALCQGDRRRWAVASLGSVVAMVPAMRWYSGRWVPGLFVFALPGVWAIHRYCPVLVDPPAMLLAIVAAAATQHGQWGLAAVASLAAGATKETAPVFAALYAWSPLPLIGLLAPLARHFQAPGEDVVDEADHSHYAIKHPFAAAWAQHRGSGHDASKWVTPWGACLLGIGKPSPQAIATAGAAYGQCAVATDSVRLYQWAWPVMARDAVDVAGRWWLAALIAHTYNPWKGKGG